MREIFQDFDDGRDLQGFFFNLGEVFRELVFGEDFQGEVEAGPGAPGSEGGTLSGHTGGEVLEMADRISDEEAVLAMIEKPDEGGVGSWQGDDHGRFIELEDGLGGFPLKPE